MVTESAAKADKQAHRSEGRRDRARHQRSAAGEGVTAEAMLHAQTTDALLNASAQAADSALVIDRDGVVIAVSQSFARRHGCSADEMVGTVLYDHLPSKRAALRRRQNRRVVREGAERRFIDRQDGRITETAVYPIHDDAGSVVQLAIFSRDITAQRTAEKALQEQARRLEKLRSELEESTKSLTRSKQGLREKSLLLQQALTAQEELARQDPLTRSLNHRAIMEMIAVLTSRKASKFAVVLADVDSMKAINDSFGHQTGDAVLIEVARALSHGKAMVGRYGGDEFLVILPGADRATADVYRASVKEALAEITLARDGEEPSPRAEVSVSLGVAVWPADGPTAAQLISVSDAAMYAEKRSRASAARGEGGLDRLGTELTELLTDQRSPDAALQTVCDHLAAAWRSDVTRLVVVDDQVYRSASAYRPDFVSRSAVSTFANEAADRELLKLLVREGRHLVVDDMMRDGRLAMRLRTASLTAGIRSGLIAPILWRRDLKGILLLFNRRRAAFSPAVVASAEQTADLLGAVLIPRVVERAEATPEPAPIEEPPPTPAAAAAPELPSLEAYAPFGTPAYDWGV